MNVLVLARGGWGWNARKNWPRRGADVERQRACLLMIFLWYLPCRVTHPSPHLPGQKNLGEDSLFVGQLLAKAVAGFLVDLPECYPLAWGRRSPPRASAEIWSRSALLRRPFHALGDNRDGV